MRSRPGRADGRGRSDDAHPAHGRKVEAAQGPYTIRHLYLVIVSNRLRFRVRSRRLPTFPGGPPCLRDGTSVRSQVSSRTAQVCPVRENRRGKTEAGRTADVAKQKRDAQPTWQNRSGTHSRHPRQRVSTAGCRRKHGLLPTCSMDGLVVFVFTLARRACATTKVPIPLCQPNVLVPVLVPVLVLVFAMTQGHGSCKQRDRRPGPHRPCCCAGRDEPTTSASWCCRLLLPLPFGDGHWHGLNER